MSLTLELRSPTSPITTFLDARLRNVDAIERQCAQILGAASRVEPSTCPDWSHLGSAFELSIGFDLAEAVPYEDLLIRRPVQDCDRLLHLAGFTPQDGQHGLDAMWLKDGRGPLLDGETREYLGWCWELITYSALRKRPPALVRMIIEQDRVDKLDNESEYIPTPNGNQLGLWAAYQEHGRQQLARLGRPVAVSPKFLGGFAMADLVLGDTLVEIKLVEDPTPQLRSWLHQLLGYELADTDDHHQVRRVAILSGWHMSLPAWNLAQFTDIATDADLAQARQDFAALCSPVIAEIQARAKQVGPSQASQPWAGRARATVTRRSSSPGTSAETSQVRPGGPSATTNDAS